MQRVLFRICFFLPVILFLVFVFMVALGIVANLMHAGPLFFCGIYCKAVISILLIAIVSTVACQIKACK